MFEFFKYWYKDKNEQMRYSSLPPMTDQEVLYLIFINKNICWDVNNIFKCSKIHEIFDTVLDKKARKDVQLHRQYLNPL